MSLKSHPNGPDGKISVYPQDERLWHKTVGVSPSELYGILTRGLPHDVLGDISISFDLSEGDPKFVMSSKSNNLYAERQFSIAHKTLTLIEIKVGEDIQDQGIGKQMLENHLDFARRLNLRTINLRAGRERGEYFFPRQGAALEDGLVLKERFRRAVNENAAKLDLSPDEQVKLKSILDADDIWMAYKIAALGEMGKALLAGTNPRLQIKLDENGQKIKPPSSTDGPS